MKHFYSNAFLYIGHQTTSFYCLLTDCRILKQKISSLRSMKRLGSISKKESELILINSVELPPVSQTHYVNT